jgi:hypothetical protein
VYERCKDYLPVLNVVKRMLIEIPLSILPIGLRIYFESRGNRETCPN